ncbi:MAG: leucine-rich repeat domain-containing protein [Acutalibacteraceae bacterium]
MAAIMLVCAAPLAGISMRADATTDPNIFVGDNITWELENGTLTLSGTGEMRDLMIASSPFSSYDSLTKVVIENGITNIGYLMFWDCKNLESIEIPASLTSINGYPFGGCDNFKKIIVDEDNPVYSSDESGILFNKDKTQLVLYPMGIEDTVYTIPDTVREIAHEAFYDCSNLEKVEIPNSVTTIDGWAFAFCKGLESVEIPESVANIGELAFYRCDNLKHFTVDENNPAYCSDEYGVLFDKNKTQLIQYPKNTDNTAYTVPDTVKEIFEDAFVSNVNLESIEIPDSVEIIQEDAFSNCYKLSEIKLGNGLTQIGNDVFYETAFYNNEENWENGALYIGQYLIEADKLDNYDIVDYEIKDGTKTIANLAFQCELETLTIPASVTNVSDMSFAMCGAKKFIVDENNSSLTVDENGVLYNKEKTHLYRYPCFASETVYDIPESVKVLSDYAFCMSQNLESLEIPYNVTDIGDNTFIYCYNLKKFTIGTGVTSIGIGDFMICPALESLELYGDMKAIGYMSFAGCDSLKDVYFGGTQEQWQNIEVINDARTEGADTLKNATVHYNCEHTHNYRFVAEKVLPTCTEDGQITYRCSICGNSYQTEVLPATGHIDSDNDGKCDNCSELLEQPEPEPEKSLIERIKEFFETIINWLKSLFGII